MGFSRFNQIMLDTRTGDALPFIGFAGAYMMGGNHPAIGTALLASSGLAAVYRIWKNFGRYYGEDNKQLYLPFG